MPETENPIRAGDFSYPRAGQKVKTVLGSHIATFRRPDKQVELAVVVQTLSQGIMPLSIKAGLTKVIAGQ